MNNSKKMNIVEEETVAALIVYGYEEGSHAAPTQRNRRNHAICIIRGEIKVSESNIIRG